MKISFVAGLLSASASTAVTAATVAAEYEAFSSISVRIASATFESSGADARAALSNGTWQDGADSYADTSGTGLLERSGSGRLRMQGVDTYDDSSLVRGYASETETSGSSFATGWVTPTFNYSHECTRFSLDDCAGIDRIMLELAFEVVTSATATVLNPLTGSASATAHAFLGMEYFRDEYIAEGSWRPEGGWDFEANGDGNSFNSGTIRFAMEAGSALGLNLYTRNVSGSASYTPLVVTPLPPAIPLMASGILLLGLMSRRGRRR